jgi:hypothetical protein
MRSMGMAVLITVRSRPGSGDVFWREGGRPSMW